MGFELIDGLPRHRDRIEAAIAHEYVDQFKFEAIVAAMEHKLRSDPKLARCTPASILNCMVQCLQLGMDPSGLDGQIALIPYGTKCTVLIQYQGQLELMRRSGQIDGYNAMEVREKDDWYYDAANLDMRHVLPRGRDRGQIERGYARVWLKGMRLPLTVIFDYGEWQQIVQESRSPAYKKWAGQMLKKSCYKRLVHIAPKSRFNAIAAGVENDNEHAVLNSGGRYSVNDSGDTIIVPADEVSEVPTKKRQQKGKASPKQIAHDNTIEEEQVNGREREKVRLVQELKGRDNQRRRQGGNGGAHQSETR